MQLHQLSIMALLSAGTLLPAAQLSAEKEWDCLINFERDAAGTPSGSTWNNITNVTTPGSSINQSVSDTSGATVGTLTTSTLIATGAGPDWKPGASNLTSSNLFPSGITGPAGYETAAIQSFWNTNSYANPMTITITGLSAGWYSLDVLGARNNGNLAGAMSLSASCDSITYYSMGTTAGAASGTWSAATTLTDATTVDPFGFIGGSHNGTNNGSAVYASFQGFYIEEGGSLTLTMYSSSSTENGGVANNNAALNYMVLSKYSVVPEPATAGLGLLGLAVLTLRRRRNS